MAPQLADPARFLAAPSVGSLSDARAADLALSLTPGQLMPRGRRKRILRADPARRFPPDVTRRPKSGFAFPIGELLRTDPRAAAACRGLLLAPDALAGLPTAPPA